MSNLDEKEKLNEDKKEKNSSDEEDNKKDEKIKNIFKSKEKEDEEKEKESNIKTEINTNQIDDMLLIKEKVRKIRNMKLDSDELLKNKKYEDAIDNYKETINTLLDEISTLTINMQILNSIKEEILIPCYQNIALCNMKLNKWIKVKTYSKKVLEFNKNNIKANYRLCLANIKLGHLKKADYQLEELERLIGGTPELEELEKIYEVNKLNSEGNNGEFLRKMGRKLKDGKINMYSDKKSKFEIEYEKAKDSNRSVGFLTKIKNIICFCCKKKRKKIKRK